MQANTFSSAKHVDLTSHVNSSVSELLARTADRNMAELLGLVASIIQVSGAGVQLSKTLYKYVDGVAAADRRTKNIATEIKMTSIAIEELGDVSSTRTRRHWYPRRP